MRNVNTLKFNKPKASKLIGSLLLFTILFSNVTPLFGQTAENIIYEYDRLNRLIRVTYVSSGASIIYTYDAAGNRTALMVQGSNSAPSATVLSPSSTTAGTTNFSLDVTGTNLVNGAIVQWNGSDRPTTYFGTFVRVQLTDADLASPGTASVKIVNPEPNGATTNALTFTISQPSNCSFSLPQLNIIIPPAGGTGSFTVNTQAGCAWTAITNDPWITINSGNNGVGTGTVSFTVQPNLNPPRIGTINVGGQTFSINQSSALPGTPTIAAANVISSTQINVFWNQPPADENVTSYNLRINGSNVISGITHLSYAVGNLTPGTTYAFEVQAVNAFGVSPWSNPVSATTTSDVISTPTIASATAVSPTRINVFWNQSPANENVIDYDLRVNGSTIIPNITFLSYGVTELTPNTTYSFEVRARNAGGVSNWSTAVNAITLPTTPPPNAPATVSPQVVSSTQINVFWDASTSPDVSKYNLRINGSTVINDIAFLSYAVRNLTPNTTYSFEVQAVNSSGVASAWTTPVSATTTGLQPPPRISPQAVSTTQINVFWDASPSPSVTKYNLRINGSTVVSDITFLSYAVRNLNPGTSYSFEVQAVDSSGNLSAWSAPQSASTLTILPPPRVSPQTISTSQINVFWDSSPSPNISSYNLRINGSGGTVINDIRFLSYAVRNLDPGTTYSFEVQAVDSSGAVSNWSTSVSATTQSLMPPPKVSPQTVSSTQINVFWDASPSAGVTKYNLRINGTTVVSDIAFLSYAVRNLNPNTTYSFEVQTVAGNFTSAWSAPVSATTSAAPLPSPRVSPQVVSSSRINVFWDASPSANVVGYNLRINGTTVISNIAFLSYGVTNLTPNTTYTFEVQAIDSGGAVSNWTTPVNASTLPASGGESESNSWLTGEWRNSYLPTELWLRR